jgi:hypothetical protein
MEAGLVMTMGKPRFRWLEDTGNYLRELKWWQNANKREGWPNILKKKAKFL